MDETENDVSGWGTLRDIARDWFDYRITSQRVQQAPYGVTPYGTVYPVGTPAGVPVAQLINSMLPLLLLAGGGLLIWRMAK